MTEPTRAHSAPPTVGPGRAAPGTVTLIYDGECSMCRASALWLLRRAEAGGARDLEILPCRSPVRRQRFPSIADETCMQAMQLVLPGGRVLSGADAAPEILRRIPRWRWIATLFDLPGARPFARRVYAWIASNRMRISCARPAAHTRER